MDIRKKDLLTHAFAAVAALALAGCGGGGGGDAPAPVPVPPPPPPPPTVPVTMSGEVARIGTLKNVVVCLDLNGNDACDAGEPASAPTGADGKYTLSYDPATLPQAQAMAARLIAPLRTGDVAAAGTAIDAADPAVAATSADYVLKRPAGAQGAINPLTTLVQAGVAAGMAEAAARDNVALQLAIDAAKIDGYQDDPAWSEAELQDTARTAAAVVSGLLRQGIALQVGDQRAAAPARTMLRQLNYNAPGGYYVRTLEQQAKAEGSAGVQAVDARRGKSGGEDRTEASLYGSAYLTPGGWTVCSRSVPTQNTVGNPSRSVYCEGETSLGWSRTSSVAGEAMADLVDRWQGMASNTINAGTATAALKGALGNAAFPADAEESVRTNIVLGQSIVIDNLSTRGLPQDRNTLEAVIAAYPSAAVALPAPGSTLSLGITTGALKNLRVSFSGPGEVQFYECDLNAEQTVASNCAATTPGSYAIDTVGGARVLRFGGYPATPAVNYRVVYAEVNWGGGNQWVYRTHETKSALSARSSQTNRLNQSAWSAMQAQLGL